MNLEVVTLDNGLRVVQRAGQSSAPQKTGQSGFADQLAQAAAKREEEAVPRKELSDQDIAELAGEYDPEHMTQAEFDALLDALVDKGALKKEDLGRLGYNGFVVTGTADDLLNNAFATYRIGGNVSEGMAFLSDVRTNLSDAGGDVLALMRARAGWTLVQASSPEKWAFEETSQRLHQIMADILGRMSAQRKD